MEKVIEIFRPGLAELRSVVERLKDVAIENVHDVEGYAKAKEAKKELANWRIEITKAGKQFRAEALAYQKEVIRQEKEHLEIITPIEDSLKAMIEAVDEAKAKEERRVLLPARQAMLAEIEIQMTEDEILALDEKQFSDVYMSKKMVFLEAKEVKAKQEAEEKRRADELAKAKEEAAARAVEEEKARAEKERIAKEAEAKRVEDERKAEEKKMKRNAQYKEWLAKHGISRSVKFGFSDESGLMVERSVDGKTFTLYKKIDEITIE